jgi:hypothetical protein
MSASIRFIKPSDLRSTVRGLAVMSVLFNKDDCRFWSNLEAGLDLGVWRDETGHRLFFLFAPKATALVGYDPESPMSPVHNPGADSRPWPGIYDELPKELHDLLLENHFGSDFNANEVTFIIWNMGKGLDWKKGKVEYPKRENGDPDGSRLLLNQLRGYFDHFEEEMDEEYERSFDADALFVIFSGEPLSADDLKRVKSDIDFGTVRDGLRVIGVTV